MCRVKQEETVAESGSWRERAGVTKVQGARAGGGMARELRELRTNFELRGLRGRLSVVTTRGTVPEKRGSPFAPQHLVYVV